MFEFGKIYWIFTCLVATIKNPKEKTILQAHCQLLCKSIHIKNVHPTMLSRFSTKRDNYDLRFNTAENNLFLLKIKFCKVHLTSAKTPEQNQLKQRIHERAESSSTFINVRSHFSSTFSSLLTSLITSKTLMPQYEWHDVVNNSSFNQIFMTCSIEKIRNLSLL